MEKDTETEVGKLVEKGKIVVSEADQLSPVALRTKVANQLVLPPLQWAKYDSKPATVYARNTGFTVMIQASFPGEVPYLCAGPLTEKYTFSQIHFHWGEHDETGSGHSVDGVRYPLEMHVVHVKKDCANLSEAGGTKDGIAITVHLFSLREERNTSLDQLTAVLQFIQRPNCCAKLYLSSLNEIIHPFNNNYFLYWGAVPGTGEQRYRIVWLVNRQLMPVSSQQLQQFRELIDGKGNFIWSNSNNPHPLGDRSLFLVSPLENISERVFHAQQISKSVLTLESDNSIGTKNAEFKSLAALQDAEPGSCAICPHPNHAGWNKKVTKPSYHSVKIKPGEASVEESCMDLGTLHDHVPAQKTDSKDGVDEIKNIKVTDCGNNCTAKYIPSQDMYSVIAANEEEIHLRRRPLTIRKSELSTEQACVFLTRPQSLHSARSAPSLTAWGHLGIQKGCMDVSDPQESKKSAEMLVLNKSLDSITSPERKENIIPEDDQIEGPAITKNFRDVATQRSESIQLSPDGRENLQILISQKYTSDAVSVREYNKEDTSEHKLKENKLGESDLFDSEGKTEYLLVKQAEPKKSYYKVIGELLMIPNSKRTFVKRVGNTNEVRLSEISNIKSKNELPKEESSMNKSIVSKKIVLSLPPSPEEASKYKSETDSKNSSPKGINLYDSHTRSTMIPHSKVKLEVQTSVADHQNRGKNEEDPKKYYVTKITPVIKSQEENYTVSIENKLQNVERKLYYARPITERNVETSEKERPSPTSVVNELAEDFLDVRTTISLEDLTPSDHLLSIKKANTNKETYVKVNTVLPSHTTSQDLSYPLEPKISVKILKSQKSHAFQVNGNISNQSNNIERALHNDHKVQNDLNQNQSNNSNNKQKIKLAISIKSHGEGTKSNELQKRSKSPSKDPPSNDVKSLNSTNSHESKNNGFIIEKGEEENLVYSQKYKKTTTVKPTKPTYRLSSPPLPPDDVQASSQHLVTVKKVEVPDPYYLARVPRKPLTEYQTKKEQQVETTEVEERISELKTSFKTYTSIKKNNIRSANESIELQSNKSKSIKENNNKNIIATEEKTENLQRINIGVSQSKYPKRNESIHSINEDQTNEEKITKIVIGSHQPRIASKSKVIKFADTSRNESNDLKSQRILHQQENKLSDQQNQGNTINLMSSKNKIEGSSIRSVDSNDKKSNEGSSKTNKSERVSPIYKAQIQHIDVATSNSSEYLPESSHSQSKDLNVIEGDPTRDQGLETNVEMTVPDSQTKVQSIANIPSVGNEIIAPSQPDLKTNKSNFDETYTKSDKDIVYIHLREHSTTKNNSPVSNLSPVITNEKKNKQESQSEKVIKSSKEQSEFKKSMSVNVYHSPKSEEIISMTDYEGANEDELSQCNVTFKSETKMELSGTGGQALVKTMAEVKFKPSKKSGTSSTPRSETKSTARSLTNEAAQMTVDKCCSTLELQGVDTSVISSMDEEMTVTINDNINYSPVKIVTEQTVVKFLPSIKFIDHWDRPEGEDALLENNGKTVRATFLESTNQLPRLRGGPLETDYIFAELHFHWGRKDCCGAEHIIDDQRFSMEAHFLYYKEEYKNVKEALNHEDGLAMVAIQMNVGGPLHPQFGELIRDISLIREADTGVYVPAEALFSWIKQTVEESGGYYSYKGTMTMGPPHVEAVTWLIFKQPIAFCCQHTLEFRKLRSKNGELLLKTYRAPKPLNNRRIFYVPY